MKRNLVITLSIVMALLAIWCVFAPRISWDGAAVGRILVSVVDKQTLTPIAGAAVELHHPRKDEAPPGFGPQSYDKLIAAGTTDPSGTARITAYFNAGGSTGVFGRSGRVVYSNIWLQVSADGHETVRTRLSQYAGQTRSIRGDQATALTIELAATPNAP